MRSIRGAGAQAGYISVQVLILLVFLSAAGAGLLLVLQQFASYEIRSAGAAAERGRLEDLAARVIAELAADPSPGSDAPGDPVHAFCRQLQAETGLRVTLADVSSALNPNWVRKGLFENTELGTLFEPGATPDGLQQHREEKGFALDLPAGYGELFSTATLQQYFSPYGYANLNVTDEFALRALYRERTGDAPGAEAFHGRIQDLLREKKLVAPDDLPDFLGAAYGQLFPVINVEPSWNVHFLAPLTLRELLVYPAYQVEGAAGKAQYLLDAREGHELSEEDLRSIIGEEPDRPVYAYLGVRTWFWKLEVGRAGCTLRVILARYPEDVRATAPAPSSREAGGKISFRVVEKRLVR